MKVYGTFSQYTFYLTLNASDLEKRKTLLKIFFSLLKQLQKHISYLIDIIVDNSKLPKLLHFPRDIIKLV